VTGSRRSPGGPRLELRFPRCLSAQSRSASSRRASAHPRAASRGSDDVDVRVGQQREQDFLCSGRSACSSVPTAAAKSGRSTSAQVLRHAEEPAAAASRTSQGSSSAFRSAAFRVRFRAPAAARRRSPRQSVRRRPQELVPPCFQFESLGLVVLHLSSSRAELARSFVGTRSIGERFGLRVEHFHVCGGRRCRHRVSAAASAPRLRIERGAQPLLHAAPVASGPVPRPAPCRRGSRPGTGSRSTHARPPGRSPR